VKVVSLARVPVTAVHRLAPPAAGVAYFNQVAVVVSTVNTSPLFPKANLAGVLSAVAVNISPFASTKLLLIFESNPVFNRLTVGYFVVEVSIVEFSLFDVTSLVLSSCAIL